MGEAPVCGRRSSGGSCPRPCGLPRSYFDLAASRRVSLRRCYEARWSMPNRSRGSSGSASMSRSLIDALCLCSLIAHVAQAPLKSSTAKPTLSNSVICLLRVCASLCAAPVITSHSSVTAWSASKLLDFALDPCLFGVFHEDFGSQQDIAVQFRLARAVAADGVDVHAAADHVVGQDRRVLLVGGAGRDDLRALHCLFGGVHWRRREARAGQIAAHFSVPPDRCHKGARCRCRRSPSSPWL